MDFFLILFTVCTAPLFSYSAVFIAASVQIVIVIVNYRRSTARCLNKLEIEL